MDVPLLQELNVLIVVFLISLSIRAIFSFLETSITALRLFKLKELASSNSRYEQLFVALEKNPHRVLITTLIVSSFSDVIAAATATSIMETIFSRLDFAPGIGFTLGIGIAGFMIIIFGEILPKNLARGRGERLFNSLIWVINLAYYALYIPATVLIWLSDKFIHRFSEKSDTPANEWVSSEREVRFLIDYIHAQGIMETEKTEMLRNIFDLGRIIVKDIMVPSTDIMSIEINTPISKVLETYKNNRFTRLPVYEKRSDNIVGMVYLKDIFAMLSEERGEKPLRELVRPIMFVPESLKISQLLREFRQQHMHIAIVLNEHGSITGLITLEDVLEEIVGEISDEHEPSTEKILPLLQGGWLVDASVPLEDLSEILQIEFKAEESITLGGFLTEFLQHLPKKGERVLYKGYYFQIQKASPKRVNQVLIFEEKNNIE